MEEMSRALWKTTWNDPSSHQNNKKEMFWCMSTEGWFQPQPFVPALITFHFLVWSSLNMNAFQMSVFTVRATEESVYVKDKGAFKVIFEHSKLWFCLRIRLPLLFVTHSLKLFTWTRKLCNLYVFSVFLLHVTLFYQDLISEKPAVITTRFYQHWNYVLCFCPNIKSSNTPTCVYERWYGFISELFINRGVFWR